MVSVAIAIAQDLFSDDAPDFLAFQDLSPDLFASQELPMDSNWIDNDDLFGGPDAEDFSLTGTLDPLNLEASCMTGNKLRSRDGSVCSPSTNSDFSDETPIDGYIRDRTNEIKRFEDLRNETPPHVDEIRPWTPDFKCLPGFPHHLYCLQELGPSQPELNMISGYIGSALTDYSLCKTGA